MRVLIACLFLASGAGVSADDNEQLNGIYKAFLTSPVDLEHIRSVYDPDVIHVGHDMTPLLRGIDEFIDTNVKPLADAINSGAIAFTGKVYVMRRSIVGDMANDVGYLHAVVDSPEHGRSESVQKFSWVFVKADGRWRVLTDFDAQAAPLDVLDGLQAAFVIE